jgi:uncharacterized protein
MIQINIKLLKSFFLKNKKSFRSFLTKLENNPPPKLHSLMLQADAAVWKEIECLSCGNCCKKMTPTFSTTDIKRIAAHFNLTPQMFKDKWLTFDKKAGDWQNVKQPCQFLNKVDNKCSIYPIRPSDCAGFPHFTKKRPTLYMHVHKQNIEYCPATFKMVEKMKALVKQQ